MLGKLGGAASPLVKRGLTLPNANAKDGHKHVREEGVELVVAQLTRVAKLPTSKKTIDSPHSGDSCEKYHAQALPARAQS